MGNLPRGILHETPCMDDACLRRGNPAVHLCMGKTPPFLAVGVDGMVGGQALDLGYADERLWRSGIARRPH